MSDPQAPFVVRHERSVTMAVVVVIPLFVVLGLMWREQRERIADIQHSRAELTYVGCLETNARHGRTVDQLDRILATRKAQVREDIIEAEAQGDAARASALRAQLDSLDDGRATTVSLIAALMPVQNCRQVVLDRFGHVPDIPDPEEES